MGVLYDAVQITVLYDVVLFGKGKMYCIYYQDLYKEKIKT